MGEEARRFSCLCQNLTYRHKYRTRHCRSDLLTRPGRPLPETHSSEARSGRPDKPSYLGPKRAAFQWLVTLMILGIPFVRIDGQSLLRLDFGDLTLHAFGARYPITDLSLFLLLVIALTLLFLLITLAFGRAWCGWACPQTTLVDLVEWFARKIGVRVEAGAMTTNAGQKVALQVLYVFLALLVGANLVWYFVSPYEFFPQLMTGTLHWVAGLTLAIVAVTTYLDLAFLRRLFCKEFCPYGRFQTVLVDPGTLVLHYHPDEAPRCIKCGACVRSCPTGIDIRNGYQIECINCGRCLDACRNVMARRQQPGIIRYTFGLEGKGVAALLNIRMALVSLALIGVVAGLVLASTQRDEVAINIGRNPTLLPRTMAGNRVANFYTAYLTNRTGVEVGVMLSLASSEEDLVLSGPGVVQVLAPAERRRIDFAVFAERNSLSQPRPVDILVVSEDGRNLAESRLFLTKPRTNDE